MWDGLFFEVVFVVKNGGRYDLGRMLKQNLTLRAAILSCLHLIFFLLDECEKAADTNVGMFITSVHAHSTDVITSPSKFNHGQF